MKIRAESSTACSEKRERRSGLKIRDGFAGTDIQSAPLHTERSMKRVAVLVWILAMAVQLCAAQARPPAAPSVEIAIHAGKVLDVRTGKYAADQIIWIEGDRIKAIGSAAEMSARIPAGAKTIDLSQS